MRITGGCKFKSAILTMMFILYSGIISAATYTNLLIDNFTNNDFTHNNLGGYCEVYAYQGWSWGNEGSTWWDGSHGAMASAFSNTNTGFYFYYLSILTNSTGGYLNFTDSYNNYAIKVLLQNDASAGKPDVFQLEKLQLKDAANSLIGEIYFSNYNGGTNAVPSSDTEYIFPINAFTNSGNKNFAIVKAIVFFTSITQNCQFKMTDLMIVRGVEVAKVYMTNKTQKNTNSTSGNKYEQLAIKVLERSNVYGCSGYVILSNSITHAKTNIALSEITVGDDGFYYADFIPHTNGTYYVDTILSNSYAKDTDGSAASGWDYSFFINNNGVAIKISSLDSFVGSDSSEEYAVGNKIKFVVKESNNQVGASGKIIISSALANSTTNISLIDKGDGSYECEWDTSGLTPARDYEIESQLGSDIDGYNDTGIDMSISLYQIGEVSFFSNKFYQKYSGEAYIDIPDGALKDSAAASIDIGIVSVNTGDKALYGKIYKFLPENLQFAKVVKIGLPVPSSTGYALYTYNGFEWFKINSTLQTYNSSTYLEGKTYTTGIFAIFQDSSAAINKIFVSRRVFSPNNDGVNDVITINIPGSINDLSSIVVYNIDGREIKNLNNTLLWDGTDNNSKRVKSGVYVIKVNINNKTYYKTVTIINK